MENKEKIIALLRSQNYDNIKLGLQLEESQQIDLSDFWADLRSLYALLYKKKPSKRHLAGLFLMHTIDLSDKGLHKLPENFIFIDQLQELFLDNNQLININDQLPKGDKIYSISLTRNYLTEIPSKILNYNNLLYLNLDDNPFKTIPESLSKLNNLKHLYLAKCQLYCLPSVFKFNSLERLDLRFNQITELPASLCESKHLIDLNLGQNKLKTLAPNFGELTNLIHLSLNENLITDFPTQIFNLKNLFSLNLGNNPIKNIPKNIRQMTNLKRITLSGTLLQEDQKKHLKSMLPEIIID
jgi:internalin A